MAGKNLVPLIVGLLTLRPVLAESREAKPAYYNSVVRIGGCSGVLIKKGDVVTVGVSAQHCTGRVGTTVYFNNPDGTGGVARWIAEDVESDLSLFRVWTKDTKGVVAPVQADSEKPDKVFRGLGYPRGEGPKRKVLTFEGTFHIDSLAGERNQFSVDSGVFYNGDSGGGVFNKGKLFAITSHGSKNHKHLFSCTKKQLNAFLKREADNLDTKLVEWDISKAPPLGSDKDRTVALAAVIKKLAELDAANKKLREELRKILDTPTRVQVLDPKTGKILAEESYPFGTPIKLVLPEVRK